VSLPFGRGTEQFSFILFIDFLRSIWIWTTGTCPVLYFAPTCIVGYHVFTGLGMASLRRRGRLCRLWGLNPLLDLALGLCWHHFTACRCLRLFLSFWVSRILGGAEVTWDTWDVVMHAPAL
jgi:hypothetical protein